jgi:hypothetical protein
MPIKTSRLIVEFDRRFDRFAGQNKAKVRLEHKLSLLNEAVQIFFENRVKLAEINSTVREELRPLEEKERKLKIKKHLPEMTIAEYPKDYFQILRATALISREGCPKKIVPVIKMATDDLSRALKNANWRSSFEWEHLIGDEGKEGLYLYHGGDFTVEEVYSDYYRKPAELHAPSMTTKKEYEDWNGVIQKKDVDLELDNTFAYRKIVDIAVLLARTDIGDQKEMQMQLNKILQIEPNL